MTASGIGIEMVKIPLLILFCKLFDSLKSRIPVNVEHWCRRAGDENEKKTVLAVGFSIKLLCDATSVAVSPSPVVAVGKSALSAVGLMPPCGVRARVYPDPAVLGAGLGENIVSIMLLPQTRNGHDGTARR